MTPDSDKNKTYSVEYLPKVTGLHKVRWVMAVVQMVLLGLL